MSNWSSKVSGRLVNTKSSFSLSGTSYASPLVNPTPLTSCVLKWNVMSWEPGPVSPVMTSWPRPSNSTTSPSAGGQELNAKPENGNDWLKSTVNDGGMTEGGCDVGADRAFITDTDEVDVPLPWQLMRWMREKKHRPNIFQILWRAGMVNSNAMTAAHREKTDLLLQPPLAQIDMLNWKGFDRAIAAGYEYAVRRLEKLPLDSPLRQGARPPD